MAISSRTVRISWNIWTKPWRWWSLLGISSDDLRGFLNAIRTYEWWHLMLTQSSEKDPTHLQSPALHKQRNEIRKNGDRWEGLLKSLQRTSALGFFLYFLVAHAQLALIFPFWALAVIIRAIWHCFTIFKSGTTIRLGWSIKTRW